MERESQDEKLFPKAETCTGKLEVPTEKERAALAALKEIKTRVRALKKEMASLQRNGARDSGPQRTVLEEELASLKAQWDTWEEKRENAAKERMVLLGHEKEE